jgi:hypothetical protein
MTESVLTFSGNNLIGILSLPNRVDPSRPVVLIPNTGIEHRVGPNRLHVRLARAFADSGIVAARVDLSGLGDSPAISGSSSVPDLQEAMTELGRRGFGNRFVAVGLCSGAHDAHQLALADHRVVGAAFLDGYAYSTPQFYLTYLLERLTDPARLLRFLRGLLQRHRHEDSIDVSALDYVRRPRRADMRRDLATFMERGLALSFVYTGQLQYVYNYADQLLDAFPDLCDYTNLELHHLTWADHTFSTEQMSDALISRLVDWLQKSCSNPPVRSYAEIPVGNTAIAA